MNDLHDLLRSWETFYLLLGTAGATLAGLIFVAVTVAERITDRERVSILRAHLDPALLALLLVVILSACLLIPHLTRPVLAALLLMAGTGTLGYMGVVLRSLHRGQDIHWDASDWTWYAAAPLLGGTLLLISGVLTLTAQAHAATTLTGVTLLLLLIMGVRNAWDLVTFSVKVNAPDPDRTDDKHTSAPTPATSND